MWYSRETISEGIRTRWLERRAASRLLTILTGPCLQGQPEAWLSPKMQFLPGSGQANYRVSGRSSY